MDRRLMAVIVLAMLSGVILGYVVALVNFQSYVGGLLVEIEDLNTLVEDLQRRVDDLRSSLEFRVLGVYFSPNGGCEDQVIYWIGRANETIYIMMYSFTLDSIGDALIDAHRRGVKVMIVLEKSQITQYSEYRRLKEAGIMIRNDTNPNLMHNKVMIVDGLIVLTGSFNWSWSAENRNNENLIVIRSRQIAAIYMEEFWRIWKSAE